MNKELIDFIESEAKKLGYTVLEVSLKGKGGLSADIVLDKEGGITLEECSAFNRMVSLWLDKSAFSAKGYTVDVASPGLDRVLKSDKDFIWASGKNVRVAASAPEGGTASYEGELKLSGDRTLTIAMKNGNIVELDRKNIIKAQLSPEI